MRRALLASIIAMVTSVAASADSVGIRFDEMKVGTLLVTKVHGFNVVRMETYLGVKDGFHVIEYKKIKADATVELAFTNYYDAEGRRVRAVRNTQPMTFDPFSCEFALGECFEWNTVPFDFTEDNTEMMEWGFAYENQLEGDTLKVRRALEEGGFHETTYQLGKFNLRYAQDYIDPYGTARGFSFIELREPD